MYDGTVQHALLTHKFTGKERDPESTNDYFGACYYASTLGRFLSPDEPLRGQTKESPQSWNLYAYVQNNPTNAVDPDGHDCLYINDAGTAVESIQKHLFSRRIPRPC